MKYLLIVMMFIAYNAYGQNENKPIMSLKKAIKIKDSLYKYGGDCYGTDRTLYVYQYDKKHGSYFKNPNGKIRKLNHDVIVDQIMYGFCRCEIDTENIVPNIGVKTINQTGGQTAIQINNFK